MIDTPPLVVTRVKSLLLYLRVSVRFRPWSVTVLTFSSDPDRLGLRHEEGQDGPHTTSNISFKDYFRRSKQSPVPKGRTGRAFTVGRPLHPLGSVVPRGRPVHTSQVHTGSVGSRVQNRRRREDLCPEGRGLSPTGERTGCGDPGRVGGVRDRSQQSERCPRRGRRGLRRRVRPRPGDLPPESAGCPVLLQETRITDGAGPPLHDPGGWRLGVFLGVPSGVPSDTSSGRWSGQGNLFRPPRFLSVAVRTHVPLLRTGNERQRGAPKGQVMVPEHDRRVDTSTHARPDVTEPRERLGTSRTGTFMEDNPKGAVTGAP